MNGEKKTQSHAVLHISFIQPCCFPKHWCSSFSTRSQFREQKWQKDNLKYKVNRFLSSLRPLPGWADEHHNCCRSWSSVGHLLVTMNWETGIPTAWNLAADLWPVKCLHLVILTQQNGSLGRCSRQNHWAQLQASNKPLWNQTKKGNIQSLFPLCKQVSDPLRAPAPPWPYEMEPHTWHAAVEQARSHLLSVSAVSLCCSLLQAFLSWCYTTDMNTIKRWVSPAHAVPDVWQSWRMLLGVLLPWELWRDLAVKPHPHS